VGVLFIAPTALAATETAGATGVEAVGPVTVAPLPNASCTSTTTTPINLTAATVTLPGVGTTGILHASCTSTTSHADVANTSLFNGQLVASLLTADCTPSGASSKFVGTVNGNTIGDSAYHDINIPNLARVQINETSGPNAAGETVQNALHITVLSGSMAQDDIYLGQARCKVNNTPVVPEVTRAVLLPLTALSVFGAAFYLMRRRRDANRLAL
jgi:hypothetical protein